MLIKYPKFVLFLALFCLIGAGVFLARLEISDFFSGYFSNIWEGEEIPTQTAQNLVLLNSHSHPEAGEKWVVSFETIGPGDLTITPTDPDSIGDLDFISLTCDGKEKTEGGPLQILDGDVIYYSDWQCDGTGELIHLVNIARKHTLKFQFGGKMAFAYNNPDSVTDTFTDESKIATSSNITVDTVAGQVKLSTCKDYGTACSAPGECCSGNCIDNVCCNSDCTGLCKTCSGGDGGTAGTCHNTNDNYDLDSECAGPSYNACGNQYTRIGPDGYCDGSGTCDTNDNTAYVSAGDVCYNGSSVDPSGSTNCGTGAQNCYCDNDWYQCDAVNNCTYDRYYVGFNSGSGCIQTGAVVRTNNVTNPAGYRCNTGSTTVYESYASIMDTSRCSETDNCSGNTRYTGYTCSGGSCGTPNGDIGCCQHSKCASSQYCSTGYACTAYNTCGERTGTDRGQDPQESNEDLRGECGSSCSVMLNSASGQTCSAKCGYETKETGNCSGTGYACSTGTCTCTSIGLDPGGTGNWFTYFLPKFGCIRSAGSCSSAMVADGNFCEDHVTYWTNCNCQ